MKKTWLALPVSALVFLTGCCSIGGKPESETRFSTDRAAFLSATKPTGENQVLPTYEKPQLAFLCVTSAHPIEWIKLETLTGKHNPELATVVYTVRKSRYWPWQW